LLSVLFQRNGLKEKRLLAGRVSEGYLNGCISMVASFNCQFESLNTFSDNVGVTLKKRLKLENDVTGPVLGSFGAVKSKT
jgi:hypothetical protein